MDRCESRRVNQQFEVAGVVEAIQRAAQRVVIEIAELDGFVEENGQVEALVRLPNPVERTAVDEHIDDERHRERARRALPLRFIPRHESVDH